MLPVLWLIVTIAHVAATGELGAERHEADPQVAALLAPIRDKYELPGIAGGIVIGEKLVAVGAVGVRKAGAPEKMNVDDQVHIGSDTKAMTATPERSELLHHLTHGTESFAESLTYFPEPDEFHLGPEGYLEHIRKAKAAVSIPVIASLNGSSPGGWTDYARLIEQAGADALELNIYYVATDMDEPAEMVEGTYLDILEAVKSVVSIPVAVKLSPFFSNFANVARRLDRAAANGLVLFNRFYQPDIDLHTLDVRPNILLSTPQALRLPMRWIAILYGRIKADLAATSGIHHAEDVVKMLLVGARVTMLCSVLLHKGIEYIRVLERAVGEWLEQREYDSVEQMQGSMSQLHSPDPTAFERAQYVRGLQSYRPG